MWEITKDYFVKENGEEIRVLKKGDIVSGNLVSSSLEKFFLSVKVANYSLLLDQDFYKKFVIPTEKENVDFESVDLTTWKKLRDTTAAKVALISLSFFILFTIYYFIKKKSNYGRRKKRQ